MFGRAKVAMLSAEFLGAALLTSCVLALGNAASINILAALAVGITLGIIVMLFGSVSGAHANPAVTFGLWTARKIETTKAVAYIAAQLLGGLAAWRLFEYLSGATVAEKAGAFEARVWIAELIGTALLTFGVMAAINRSLSNSQSAAVIGSSLFIGIMIASVGSLALLNPAIAAGVNSFNAAYVLGPLLGGVVGVNGYLLLFTPRAEKTKVTAVSIASPSPVKSKTKPVRRKAKSKR